MVLGINTQIEGPYKILTLGGSLAEAVGTIEKLAEHKTDNWTKVNICTKFEVNSLPGNVCQIGFSGDKQSEMWALAKDFKTITDIGVDSIDECRIRVNESDIDVTKLNLIHGRHLVNSAADELLGVFGKHGFRLYGDCRLQDRILLAYEKYIINVCCLSGELVYSLGAIG